MAVVFAWTNAMAEWRCATAGVVRCSSILLPRLLMAALSSKKDAVEAQIREVAALVLASGPGPQPVVIEARATTEDFSDIQPRQRQLLGLLRDNPGRHTHDFAKRMYGRDTEAARRSVTAYFSRLKARHYVEAVGPGLFRITEKGIRAAIDPEND
jgi:hypothetical protein